MRLTELDPQFLRYEDRPYTGDFCAMPIDTDEQYQAWKAAGSPTEQRTEMREHAVHVDTLAEAQGIRLKCPVCRTHVLGVAFRDRGVLDHQGSHDRNGNPSRWQVSGTGLDDLTLKPSIDLTGPSRPNCWHGFITNGEIT